MTGQRGPTTAPYVCLARAPWVPYVLAWDPETGEIRGVEGPRGFASTARRQKRVGFLVGAVCLVVWAS
jgi:hypothetical protein